MENLALNLDTNPAPTQDYSAATPMMRQFLSIKEQHRDYLLFYRMGDFYELFFEDAVTAAEVLDIALTRRGKHEGNEIPMCGVPFHSYEPYLQKLIKAGHKVAICEQMEPPEVAKKRGAKSVVKREVVRIVTPGTLTEDNLLTARESNFLAAITEAKGEVGLAWVDISTGECKAGIIDREAIHTELARLQPKEILLPEKFLEQKQVANQISEWKGSITSHVNSFFDATRGENKIKKFFGLSSTDALGFKTIAPIAAIGALIEYIELTQKGQKPRIELPKPFIVQDYMMIDPATRRNLEINATLAGEYRGSLLHALDRTVTSPGFRQLAFMLNHPLLSTQAIKSRQEIVTFFYGRSDVAAELRLHLARIPDMERALSRIAVGRGSPRDLLALRDGLSESLRVAEALERLNAEGVPSALISLTQQLGNHARLIGLLVEALKNEVPFLAREGNFIREGFDPRLDMARNAREESESAKLALRDKYRLQTGIDKLKVLENNVIGMFIEVTAQQSAKMPAEFIHRQTMANAVRYSTPELRELENRVLHAKENALNIELELFEQIIQAVMKDADDVALTAQVLSQIDVYVAFAALAQEQDYVCPAITEKNTLSIVKGRHPVVEQLLKGSFIGNDCALLDSEKLWLLTGPNMAGKSTFLRQNALIVLMAQVGSYVPAASAEIGIVDRLFSRVGAADDLARGRSTFMVEMIETATILNQATERSFVILDEIGRGTATFDGLSIAWAVIEYIHNILRCRTLFATHYHELTSLTDSLKGLACYSMKVKEWQGDVVFLHEVVKGNADRSYGIHVAKLAGLPEVVLERARRVLTELEQGDTSTKLEKLAHALPLFNPEEKKSTEPSVVERELHAINPDDLSPKEALEILYRLKQL